LKIIGTTAPGKQRANTIRVKIDAMEEFITDYPEDEMEPSANEGSGSKAARKAAVSAGASGGASSSP